MSLGAYNVRHIPDEAFRRRWCSAKYQQSHKCDDFQRYTKMELLLEFFEDTFEKHPDTMKDFLKEIGDSSKISTGDDMVDNWFSVEALLQQTGELPNGQYDSMKEMINFLRNKDLHMKLLSKGTEFGSMYLSAKRFIRRHYKVNNPHETVKGGGG